MQTNPWPRKGQLTDRPESGPPAVSPAEETPDVRPMQRPNPEPSHESLDPSAIDEASTQHGPKFMSMNPENKKIAIRLHKNLGHPDPQKLSKVLQQRGYSPRTLSRGTGFEVLNMPDATAPEVAASSHSQGRT